MTSGNNESKRDKLKRKLKHVNKGDIWCNICPPHKSENIKHWARHGQQKRKGMK